MTLNHNENYWGFDFDPNIPVNGGRLIEIPIYTEMVPEITREPDYEAALAVLR